MSANVSAMVPLPMGTTAVTATSVADAGSKVAAQSAQESQAAAVVNKPAAPVEPPQAPLPAPEEVSAAAKQIESYLRTAGRQFEFRVDEDTHITVVTVRQAATGEIIRQIPNEEVLQLAKSLGSGPQALLDLKI
jgi:flagellar protein FlaG